MRRGSVEGQMMLELFAEAEPDYKERHLSWLKTRFGLCGEGLEIAEAVFDVFPLSHAISRSGVVCCTGALDGWEPRDAVEVLGVLDPALDYHVCWDREWAARRGYSKQDVARMSSWNYAKNEPVFGSGKERR